MSSNSLPVGTRVRCNVPFQSGRADALGTVSHVFGNGLVEVELDHETHPSTLLATDVVRIAPTHARPYDPVAERQKIENGNTMGSGTRGGGYNLYGSDYPRLWDRLAALDAEQDSK